MTIDSSTVSDDRETQALLKILDWSQALPNWQRDALRRLCLTEELSNDDFDELENICLDESHTHSPLLRVHLPIAGSRGKTINVRSIRDVVNVDLLKPNEPLSFCETGMTVVYGSNGTGKSGYTKILKRVCRSRSPKQDNEILENVYTANSGKSSAVVEFSENGQRITCHWVEGSPADTRLSDVSVFDSKTAGVHVDGENEIAYTPLPMRMLEKLASACTVLKGKLDAQLLSLSEQTPSGIFNHEYEHDTAVCRLMETLNEDTEIEHVEELADLSETERARLVELERDLVDEVPEQTASMLETQLQALREIDGHVSTVLDTVSDEYLEQLLERYKTYKQAKQVARIAAEKAFSDSTLIGIGSDEWQLLWEAAREYSQLVRYPGQNFPYIESEARCVLCNQELNEDATTFLSRFEEFVKNSTQNAETDAKGNYEGALATVEQSKAILDKTTSTLGLLSPEIKKEQVYMDCQKAMVQLDYRITTMITDHQNFEELENFVRCPVWPESQFLELIQRLTRRISSLRSDAESDERKNLENELNELQDRVWLNEFKEDVLNEIDRRKRRSQLDQALGDTKTHRITTMSKQLASTLITENLCSKFSSEIENLELIRLKVDLQEAGGKKGVPRFQVRLRNSPTSRVGLVLSEGEHSCVALAAFLTELETSGRNSAIILDDPVSSLDEAFRDLVAVRLVEESRVRQVIVFTHDLAFLFLLDEICRNSDVPLAMRAVDRTDEMTGIIQRDLPVRAQPIAKLIEGMQKQLDNEKSHFQCGRRTEWEATADVLAKRLRIAWERVVEETISPVFKRLSRKVETSGLAKLTVLDISDCKVMREAYGRCSSLLHSDPTDLRAVERTPDSIQHEIDVLKKWYEGIRDRQAAFTK